MIAIVLFGQLVAGVLLVGYASFLVIVRHGLAGVADQTERDRLESVLAAARWPAPDGGLPLSGLGRAFGAALVGLHAVRLVAGTPTSGLWVGAAVASGLVVGFWWDRDRRGRSGAAAFFVLAVVAAVALVLPRAPGGAYSVSLALHIAAALIWLGHMFFWSVFSGAALKRLGADGLKLRDLSLAGPGLGWPALAVLAITGAHLLAVRGIGAATLASPDFFAEGFGLWLDLKLLLVLAMVVYQAVFGHRSAPRAILANMTVALAVLALAVLLTGA